MIHRLTDGGETTAKLIAIHIAASFLFYLKECVLSLAAGPPAAEQALNAMHQQHSKHKT